MVPVVGPDVVESVSPRVLVALGSVAVPAVLVAEPTVLSVAEPTVVSVAVPTVVPVMVDVAVNVAVGEESVPALSSPLQAKVMRAKAGNQWRRIFI